jgi:regulatory protein
MAFGSRPAGRSGAGRAAPGRPGLGLSLKGRALRLLAQRDHSRVELVRKLGPHTESPAQLDTLLDELERGGFLSAERFAQSLAHRRSARFGLRRIEQELGAHRLAEGVSAAVLDALRGTERERALSAWRKKFGQPGADASERARQHRFLAQRGFTSEAIGWVLRHGVHTGAADAPSDPQAGDTGPAPATDPLADDPA